MIALAVLVLLSGAIPAHAESVGSTVVPTMFIRWGGPNLLNYVNMKLSNIVNKDVTCTVKLFDHDGNDVTNTLMSSVYTGSATNTSLVSIGTNSTFTIPANGSRNVEFYRKSSCAYLVHGIITWKSEDDTIGKALVGSVEAISAATSSMFGASYIPINNGQPF